MGSSLKLRMEAILAERHARSLGSTKIATLTLAAAMAFALPVATGIVRASAIQVQPSPHSANAPRFEVASIKPCKQTGPAPKSSPGRLSSGCIGVRGLVRMAYVIYASGRLVRDPSSAPVEGGPRWIDSEHYEIDARAEGAPSEGEMRGPMMQRLLEDRFGLKLHSETGGSGLRPHGREGRPEAASV